MKIGLDAKRAFLNSTGLGNYSRNVIRSLVQFYPEHEYFLFTPSIELPSFNEEVKNMANVTVVQPKSKLFSSHWRSYGITSVINRLGLDVYHGLSNELPYNIKKATCKKLVTIHDLIPYKEDVFRNIFEDAIAKSKMKSACKNADEVVCISHATAADVEKQYNTSTDKLKVVYQPVILKDTEHYLDELQDVKHRFHLPNEYLLQVGTVEYRKNIQIILRALKQLKNHQIHYVVVGRKTRFAKSLIDFTKNSGLKDQVQFIDPVTDDELACMYLLSKAVVYPSLYEGFGLPIVESLSFGKPVLATKGGCFEEAGGKGVYYCDTNSVDDVGATIVTMLTSNNTLMVEAGQHHIAQFNPKLAADAMMNLYSK